MDIGVFVFNRETFAKAKQIKGYGSYQEMSSFPSVEEPKKVNGENSLKVKPTIIENLGEYISFINKINTTYANPVFYRGQPNADYLLTPNCLRINPKNEHLMIEAFYRKFFDELNQCNSSIEKLMVMQHFHLPTRCLDITESPLIALYFACSRMKKFRREIIEPQDEQDWGEVILFREPSDKEHKPEKLKSIESSNISIIASTAYMEEDFSLWHLGARWKKDVDLGHDEKYIDLKSIVRCSYIVRVPHNNIRIKNQQGAFIMANANMAYIEDQELTPEALTKIILKSDDYINYYDLMNKKVNLNEKETWKLRFKKVTPYSDENTLPIFQTDPFDFRRLFYKEKGVQQVILIPPSSKKSILEELKRLNITEDFVYPDMDNVANEINEQINKPK